MKVLLFGSNGMLGQAIDKVFKSAGISMVTAARYNADYCFDFTNDKYIEKCFENEWPDIVINAAAIVDLSFCEKEVGRAYQVNARFPAVLSELCKKYNCYYVHVSTDHYYTGDNEKKHLETDPVILINEYARTKYAGEQFVMTNTNALVLRTNIVGFRENGNPTFIEWAISELKSNKKMNLFNDFYTSSMHTIDFANVLLDIIKIKPYGVYNVACSDVVNKRDFVLGLSKVLFSKKPVYDEVSVNSLVSVKRGDSLGLDVSKIEDLLGYCMPGIEETMESIKKEYLERKQKYEV